MSGQTIEELRQWIGRRETAEDIVSPRLVERFCATVQAAPLPAGDAPLGIHWCLAPAAAPGAALGEDGHPRVGGFLPPVPLPRRMWAGGALELLRPLKVGDTVTRLSTVADVQEKTGRSGRLVFVTVTHEIATGAGVAIRERQDIVYREPSSAQPPAAAAQEPRPAAHGARIDATTTLLFRYSALTFNGHRIHYDRDYARQVEFYPDLVVHGPLQATLLLNLAQTAAAPEPLRSFAFRSVSPLYAGRAFTINAERQGSQLDLWTASEEGAPAMRATAELTA